MKTHGPLATNIAIWFTMLSPVIAFLGAWLFSQLVA
jgi:hypothetical protein